MTRLQLKERVLLFLGVIILLFTLVNVYSIHQSKEFEKSFDKMLMRYYTINQFKVLYADDIQLYERYLRDKSEDNWMNYIRNDIKVREALRNMIEDAQDLHLDGYLLVQSIKNMYESYDMTVSASAGAEEAGQHVRIHRIYGLIEDYTEELLQTSLTYGFDTYDDISDQVDTGINIAICLMVLVLVISVVFASFVLENVLNPIKVLSQVAHSIEEEQFDILDLEVRFEDEIGQLNRAFNQMKKHMKWLIYELKEKQIMSERLHEQELRLMNSEKMMEKARLRFLQSQINPHFLFNTLNVISGMANLEKARVTNELILSLGRLFRYNLENKAELVPLSQELSVIKSYIYIEKKRFGERLKYVLKADADLELYYIPPFTLQPLIENCIKHGILKREEGGVVAIKIFVTGDQLVLRILDNGVGMTQEQRELITGWERERKNIAGSGEISGIGVQNVFERLKLVYEDCQIHVLSRKSRGTCIEIRISEERSRYGKDVDCG